jgi:predicted aminopeptidase
LLAGLGAGCSTLGYYAQSIQGPMAMMEAARPIPEVIDDPNAAPPLKQRLERVQQIRAYATSDLGLPDNGSYTRYADLKRPYVVWNVFAAPELSLQLKQWCYPVVGCAGYRGIDKGRPILPRDALWRHGQRQRHWRTRLGWFSTAANTFVGVRGTARRLLFHELAHQVVFVGGDTTFNESFATTVEREGVRRWLDTHGNASSREAYAEFALRREQFLSLLLKYRQLLQQNYDSAAANDVKRARKQQLFAELKQDYAVLKQQWGGFAGYDRFFSQDLTNAHLAAVGAYNDRVPAFTALLAQRGGDFPAFYAEVKRLAALPAGQRDTALDRLQAPR